MATAAILGTVLWVATSAWIVVGAVPCVVFLILLGSGVGASIVSSEEPEIDQRVGKMRLLSVVAGSLGVLAAAKVVWVQTAIAMLHDVSSRAGIEAADPFANAIESSGAGLVVAWGVAALVAAGVALSGPGRPRLPAKLAASNLLGTACLVLPVTGVIVWADGYVAELTSEVVPAHLGFEVRGSAGIAVTDRGQLEHRHALPGLFYAANQVLQRIEQLGGIDHIPKAAIVVEPGPTELVADDGIIAFDDQRICDVRAFLVEILECDCERVTLTTDRDGVLRQVELDLSLR